MMGFKSKHDWRTAVIAFFIFFLLYVAVHYVEQLKSKSVSDVPWLIGRDSSEYVQNRAEYFRAQLKMFNQNFPHGSDIEAVTLAAEKEGYTIDYECGANARKKAKMNASCLRIQKDYADHHFSQAYNILYDQNHKIVSIELGSSSKVIDN